MKPNSLTHTLLFLSLLLPVAFADDAKPEVADVSVDSGTDDGEEMPVRNAPPLTAATQAMLDDVNKRITNINTQELQTLLKEYPDTLLIDVRTPQEISLLGGHIDAPSHRNILRGWLELQIDGLIADKDTPIVVYCGVNQRSPLAADTLMKLGYSNVKNYEDGFFAWKDAGLPVEIMDKAPYSFLYSLPEEVIPGVWSAIGATAPPTYDNSGHNNNLSFVITDDGVVVMNAGESYLLAQSLHDEIKKRTDQPVKYVVLENGQGHAMLGSGYWQEQGAKVIMHQDAWHEVEERGEQILQRTAPRRDKNYRTNIVKPDILLTEDKMDLMLGSWKMEVLRPGPAHSPGDIMLWLPEKKLAISGDLAFHQRLLPVFEETDTAAWIETWPKFEALKPEYIIPGHGSPVTDIGILTRYTRDYLAYMRGQVAEILEEGGTLQDAYKIDQSAYAHLDTFEELAVRNAGVIFRAMEFE